MQFNPAVFSATEGSTATIAVSRVNGDNGVVSVNYATADGTASAGSAFTVTIENNYLTLSIARSAAPPDVSLVAEVSGSLAGPWQANTTTLINTPTQLKVRDNIPISSASQRFLHLRVSRP